MFQASVTGTRGHLRSYGEMAPFSYVHVSEISDAGNSLRPPARRRRRLSSRNDAELRNQPPTSSMRRMLRRACPDCRHNRGALTPQPIVAMILPTPAPDSSAGRDTGHYMSPELVRLWRTRHNSRPED
jgi:hypothetical protein